MVQVHPQSSVHRIPVVFLVKCWQSVPLDYILYLWTSPQSLQALATLVVVAAYASLVAGL